MSWVIKVLFAGHTLLVVAFIGYFVARRSGLLREAPPDQTGALAMAGQGIIGLYLVYAEIYLYQFWQLIASS